MGLISVVTSGKGGAGKSTVTAGLGCALARQGRRVLLIDGDAGLRSLDLMLGIGSAVYDMADIFASRCEPIRAIYPSPVCPNVSVVPAPRRAGTAGIPRRYGALVPRLRPVLRRCDHRQPGPASVPDSKRLPRGLRRPLVVSTPDMVCARDAQIIGRLLDKRGLPARLIINRLRPALVMAGKMPDVDEIMDTAALPLVGILPEDEDVAVAGANGRPLPGHCPAAACFSNIARRYLGEEVGLHALKKCNPLNAEIVKS